METYNKDSRVIVYCVCFLLNNKLFSFYNTNNIIVDVLNCIVNNVKTKKIELYIHNLNFDGILIISSLSKNYIPYELISNKTNLYSIKVFYCNKNIIFKCSYKILPLSLRELGKLEGFEKSYFPYKFVNELNLDYIGALPEKKYWEEDDYEKFIIEHSSCNYNLRKETIRYCINDVVLTQKILLNLFRIIDNESIDIRKKGLSSPGISHQIFYKLYNTFKIDENIKLEYESYIRPSYFGGRCEVFGNLYDNEYIKYYDFSGMYAQCMLENFHYSKHYFEKCKEVLKPGFYNITYRSNNDFPILPTHHHNKLMFYNGILTGTFWFEEIKLFQENNGEILSINNALIYEEYAPVFKDFITKFTNLRKDGGYYNIFGKLMINSLYGSMALKHREEVQYITFSEEEFCNIYKNTTVIDFYRVESCYIIIIKNDYKSKNFFKESKYLEKKMVKRNVSYASAIASKARIKLYKALRNTIIDGGRLLYCDTDSIFAAYDKNNTNNKTRDFEWLDFYEDAVFIAPKTYALKKKNDTIIKIKGINVKNIDFNTIKLNFYSNNNLLFNNQLIFKKTDFNLKQMEINKHVFIGKYDKRIFSLDKKLTSPIEITSLYA